MRLISLTPLPHLMDTLFSNFVPIISTPLSEITVLESHWRVDNSTLLVQKSV